MNSRWTHNNAQRCQACVNKPVTIARSVAALGIYPLAFIMMMLAIIHLSKATSTTDTICITGSSFQSEWVQGVYEYAYWDSNRPGAVYKNSDIGIYLFPQIYDNYRYWYISWDPDAQSPNSYCYVGAVDESEYTFDPYDCLSGWYTWTGSWTNDSNMILTNCNDICVSGSNQAAFDATYVWNYFNYTFQGSVYCCSSCRSSTGAWIYPYEYSDGDTYWFVASGCCDDWRNSDCWIGYQNTDYIMDLTDCPSWRTWSGSSFVTDPDMEVGRCVAETAYSCTDKCYLHDETTTCSDDCDCSSTRTCGVSGECEGTDTFDTEPSCAVVVDVPTISPTQPTNAPTSCEDYGENSNYGSNEYSFDDQALALEDLLITYTETISSDTTYFITNDSKNYLDELLQCADNDCFIQCSGKASCLLSAIEHSGINSNEIVISCDDEYACFGAQITSQIDSKYHDISIICNATDACNQMTLYILEPESLKIYCLQPRSCHAMDIYLEIDTNINVYNITDHGIIHCVSSSGCDFMHIVTNSELTQLIMYEYSANVVFDNGVGYLSERGNILCNNDRYIRFKSWITETEDTVTSTILDEYTTDQYPCDGIQIQCGDYQCDMNYYINSAKIESLNSMISVDCYWIHMQELQSIICSGDCVGSPSEDPTTAPTAAPTEPTIDPTQYPTFDPTMDPTIAPTTSPTVPPSFAPTLAPTVAPSGSPTSPPTQPPTNAPSRSPTDDVEFDAKIAIDLELGNLTEENKENMVYSIQSVKTKMEEIIQRGYFDIDLLQYERYMLSIIEVNGVNVEEAAGTTNADADSDERTLTVYDLDINNILGIPITLKSEIETYVQYSGYIITKSGTTPFIESVQQDLQIYFDNVHVYFNVSRLSDITIVNTISPTTEEEGTAIIVSVFILSIGGAMSAMAFLFNKKKGTKVDNAVFIMPLMLSLNIYDFISDVNLSINIFSKAFEEGISVNNVIFYLAMASVFFLILPYCSNLFYAMHMVNQPIIKQNPAARAWFTAHFRHFLLLVVFTAGTYPVLSLTSSRIFGLEFFNAGLLTTDLKALSAIKIRSTIYLENGPQLIIQILYSLKIGLERDTVLAFVASSLSIIATLLIFKAEQAQEDVIIAKYFIAFWNENGLTTGERQKIMQRRGLKEQMTDALCSVFTISNKSIEIGYVTPNQNGCIIHVQHSIFQEDLDALKEDLFSEQISSGYNVQVTEDFYVENAFGVLQDEICRVLVKHFRLDEGIGGLEFNVAYHKRYKAVNSRKGTLDNTHSDLQKRGNLVNKISKFHTSTRNIGTHNLVGMDHESDGDDEQEAKYDTQPHVRNTGEKRNIKDNNHNMELAIELTNTGKEGKDVTVIATKTTATSSDTDDNMMDALNSMRTEIMQKMGEQDKAQQQRMEIQMNEILTLLHTMNPQGDNNDDMQE